MHQFAHKTGKHERDPKKPDAHPGMFSQGEFSREHVLFLVCFFGVGKMASENREEKQ